MIELLLPVLVVLILFPWETAELSSVPTCPSCIIAIELEFEHRVNALINYLKEITSDSPQY